LGKFICYKCVEDSDELNAASDADTYAETVRLRPASDAGSQADIDDASDDSILQDIENIHEEIRRLKEQVHTLKWSQDIYGLFDLLKPKIADEIRDGVAAAISAKMDKNAPTLAAVNEDEYGTDEVGFPNHDDSNSLRAEVTELSDLVQAMRADIDRIERYLRDQALVMETQNAVVTNAPTTVQGDKKLDVVEPKGAYMLLLREMRDEVRKQVRADLVDEMQDDIQQMKKTMQTLRAFVSLQTEWRENLQSQMSAVHAVLRGLMDFKGTTIQKLYDLNYFKDAYNAKKNRSFRKKLFGLSANAADLPALLARLDAS